MIDYKKLIVYPRPIVLTPYSKKYDNYILGLDYTKPHIRVKEIYKYYFR